MAEPSVDLKCREIGHVYNSQFPEAITGDFSSCSPKRLHAIPNDSAGHVHTSIVGKLYTHSLDHQAATKKQ